MIKSIVIPLMLFIAHSGTRAQQMPETLNYDVELSGGKVGTMKAIRQNGQNGLMQYTLISNVNVSLLFFKVKVYYEVKSFYENDILQSATVDTKTSKGIFRSEIYKKGDLYFIKAHQYRHDLERTQEIPIVYSVAKAFFDEPNGENKVLGEFLGDYLQITARPNHQYVFKWKKQSYKYIYKNGTVNQVEKKFKFLNYVIKRVN